MPSLQATTFSQYASVPATEHRKDFAVCCSLEACAQPEQEETRKAIELVVVLDKSGSMGGQPLELCKQTMEFLIRELSDKDKLSLVTYDSNVSVDFPLTHMNQQGKEMALDTSGQIRAGSATNLSGGLLEGIQQLSSKSAAGDGSEVRSILLLTDGHANNGITDEAALVKCVEGALGHIPGDASLFTFGYGSNHNADMLRAVSDAGKGVYYFVEAADDIANAFGDCLGGLLSVAAQNIKVEVDAAPGTIIKQIHTTRKVKVHEEGKRYEVDVGDMYAEEKRDLLVELELQPRADGSAHPEPEAVAAFQVKYVDTYAGSFETMGAQASVCRPESVQADSNPANMHVSEQYNRVITAKAIQEAKNSCDTGRYEQGQAVLKRALESVSCSAATASPVSRAMQDDLQQAVQQCSTTMYARQGKYSMASKCQSHMQQRSNTSKCGGSEEVYRGSSKSAMRMKSASYKSPSPRSARSAPAMPAMSPQVLSLVQETVGGTRKRRSSLLSSISSIFSSSSSS